MTATRDRRRRPALPESVTRTSRSTATAATTSTSYDLAIRYDPATDLLRGTATIRARATQALSSFNLDLVGLTVLSVEVNSAPAAFRREGDELTVVPRRPLRDRSRFRVVVRYEGVPETVGDPVLGGISGFIHTDDGALVVGQPDVAATWYPVNDHPSDAASYRFDITVPAGLEAVANGVLTDQRTRDGWTTWSWVAREPMASYLTTATIGEFDAGRLPRGRDPLLGRARSRPLRPAADAAHR